MPADLSLRDLLRWVDERGLAMSEEEARRLLPGANRMRRMAWNSRAKLRLESEPFLPGDGIDRRR
jgi:hypothetical protein